MKIRFTLFAVFTLFFATFTNSVSAQTEFSTPQIYQGCGSLPADYRFPPRTFIWRTDSSGKLIRDSKGKLESDRIDQIVTSQSRMAFTFVPQYATVYAGDKLELEVFPFGRETDFGGTHIQNPLALKTLKLPPIPEYPEFKKSQLEEEEKQYLNWDGTPLETVKETGVWYAIIHNTNALNGIIPDILPVSEDYLNREQVPTTMAPPILYYFRGKLVKQIGNNVSPIPEGILRRLSSGSNLTDRRKLQFDTTGLPPGSYYVTLQGTAVFDGQSPTQCSKTTPPVLIRIEPRVPEISLYPPQKIVKFRNNDEYVVTATIKARAPFKLDWTSAKPAGIDLSNCPTSDSDSNYVTKKGDDAYEATCRVKTVHDNLNEGERIPISVKLTDRDGSTDCNAKKKCTEVIVNRPPKLTLQAMSENCYPVTVTATASDDDVPAQTLTIKDWKIYDQSNNLIPLPAGYEIITNSDKSQTLKINGGLRTGDYTFQATVDDGYDETTAKNSDPFKFICGGAAGIFYFGNATPDYRRLNGKVIIDQEEWTIDTEQRNRKPVGAGNYPSEEYMRFYDETTAQTPLPIDPNKNNTVTIERIVDALTRYPGYKIYVYGYADYRRQAKKYSNIELAKSRINSAVKALINRLPENLRDRVISAQIIAKNCSDDTAKRGEKNIWSDILRQDRRVELLYVFGNETPKLPSYAARCPVVTVGK